MSMTINYFCVTASVAPWEKEERVGYYTSKQAALSATTFVRNMNIDLFPGGIDVKIREYVGEVITTPAGLRLKEMLGGRIVQIKDSVGSEEYRRLAGLKFS